MYFCNFAVRITEILEKNKRYKFEIIDAKIFELNKKYFTKETESVEIFFIYDNKLFDIKIPCYESRVFIKKRLMFLDYCNTFTAIRNEFEIISNKEIADSDSSTENENNNLIGVSHESEMKSVLEVGDTIFIRTNLVSKI